MEKQQFIALMFTALKSEKSLKENRNGSRTCII